MTFLASHEFSKINELSNNHVQTKTHHMKLFSGLNSYHLEFSKIDHCEKWLRNKYMLDSGMPAVLYDLTHNYIYENYHFYFTQRLLTGN